MNNIKWTCHHLHLDKSKTMNKDILEKSFVHMKDKWKLIRDIKKNYTMDDLKKRMFSTSMSLKKQGCYKMRTFIDVDHIVGLKPLYAALEIKHILDKQGIELQLGTQLLEGLESKESIELFEKAAPLVDFIGCLPSRDKNKEKHLDIVFNKATELNKDVEAHLDQCNIPQEKETELFCDFVEKYNYNGKSRAIHSISLACQPIEYQKKIAKRLKKLDIGVIICPSAAISMKQHSEYTAPIHNSIAPIDILLEEGVNIGLGVDNIEDIFVPYCDGNMEFELRMLAEAGRIYDPNTLINIAENKMGFT
tara:strand:- start:123 stop:1040 length:918 start_codon:yes stop_codon:yes gene_type:complete